MAATAVSPPTPQLQQQVPHVLTRERDDAHP
eukprot:CAMPEP_0171966790 /NCGR_PEP_ID=MMETSP0993-20121228/194632_1 /TAXON_ID=483369 /ORGANISM="non described non described, Strain CCMP2098" /LENGTH=30 /DNA_ID= /DNA_START= /DNA_END= /DNA_ORIENTATION=